jgi:hypothetical protein
MSRWSTGVVFLLLSLVLPLPLEATGILNPIVVGNEVRAGISLPGGISADITITFEQVEGLTVESLGLDASLVSLTSGLLERLGGALVPSALPLLITIAPPAGGGLSFQGVVDVNVHTHLLPFTVDTPLRLFGASPGEPFHDITVNMGMGSYRARGRKGSFSQFLILVDLRRVNTVIADKLDRLDSLLADSEAQIAPAVFTDLTALAAQIRSKHSAGRTQEAITKTEEFVALVTSHSGTDIPDVWRATRDTVNVAGRLRAAGDTLRFSLVLKSNQRSGLLGLF